jgi:hypothetical protein
LPVLTSPISLCTDWDELQLPTWNMKNSKISRLKHSGRLAFLACILGAQLNCPWFASEALAMSMRRAPFHQTGILPTLWQAPVWRTLAGNPNATGTSDGPALFAQFSGPSGIAVDAAGSIYVADTRNYALRRLTPAGLVTTVAGQPGQFGWQDGPATTALFYSPTALALDADGNLYIGDGCVVRKLSASGEVTTIAGQPNVSGYGDGVGTNALFGWSISGLALDTNGNVYVADGYNRVVRKISPAGMVSTVAGQPGNYGHQDGSGTNAVFGAVGGLSFDHSGNLYVADNNVIRKISPAGVVTTWTGQPDNWGYRDGRDTNAWFCGLSGLAIDSQDNLYVTETENRCVRKISPEGEVSTLGGDAWASPAYFDGLGPFVRFSTPTAIAMDPSGHLLLADSGYNAIRFGSVGPGPQLKILGQPRSQTAEAGTNVTLSVVAQGFAALTYQWLANGQPIVAATGASLALSNLSEVNGGEYRVAVSDGVGFVLSHPASLQVQRAGSQSSDPLDNWGWVAGPPFTELHGLAHGDGCYVAVGGRDSGYWVSPESRGSVVTSVDGERWVKQFPITPGCLNDVAFGNGKFVLVGNQGAVFTSTNGLAWEPQTLTPEGLPDLHGITFDQGIFVAVSGDANGSIWTSTNGCDWANRGIDFGVSFVAIAAQGGRFIAVGNTIMTSTNGVDWEPANLASVTTNYLGQEITLEHIACGNGTVLAATDSGGGVLASANGLDWRDAAPTNGLSITRVTFGNGQFLAREEVSGGISVSQDGQAWSAPALIRSGERSALQPRLRFEQGLFVATGDKGALFTSTDGKSWALREEQQAMPFVPQAIVQVGERYFAGGSGPGIETSSNGRDWTLLLPTGSEPSPSFPVLAYGGGKLVAVSRDEWIFISDDGGATWTDRSPHMNYETKTPQLNKITFGGGVFVAIGSLNTNYGFMPTQQGHMLVSSNAATWTAVDFAGTNWVPDVAYGAGLFVALLNRGNGTEILTSTNGLSWNTAATDLGGLYSVAYGNGRFVTAPAGETVLTSPDGRTWSRQSVAGVSYFGGIVFGNGLFLARSDSGLFSSSDGVNWTQCVAPATAQLQTIAVGEGVFLAVGEDAILYQSGAIERLDNPRWLPNQDLEWTVIGAPHIDYRIEFSEDLLNWQTLTRVTNAPTTSSFTDPGATTRPRRFYRLLTE